MKAGERAPEFTLPDETGTDRSLTELLSSGAIVLYFYPADFTPGCTRQACVCATCTTEIQRAGLRVVGISPQSPESHAKFKAKYNLPFVLLSDQHKTVIKMYGVNGPLGIGVRRASYLIDGSRRVRDVHVGGFHDRPARGFRPQGDSAAGGEPSIVQAQHVRAADARHRHDVHGAEFLSRRSAVCRLRLTTRRRSPAPCWCGRSPVPGLPRCSCTTRRASALGSSAGATIGAIPSRAASGAAVDSIAQRRGYVDGVEVARACRITEHLRQQRRPRLARRRQRRIRRAYATPSPRAE